MLIFVTGASGSGKTVCVPGLRKRFPEFDIHDFDEGAVVRGYPAVPEADRQMDRRRSDGQLQGRRSQATGRRGRRRRRLMICH